MLAELLLKWPLIRQLRGGGDGTGTEAMSERTRALRPKHDGAEIARSICPYCGVGCGQLVYHREGKVVGIEGDPESPISRGHLCPKGAASSPVPSPPPRNWRISGHLRRSSASMGEVYANTMNGVSGAGVGKTPRRTG